MAESSRSAKTDSSVADAAAVSASAASSRAMAWIAWLGASPLRAALVGGAGAALLAAAFLLVTMLAAPKEDIRLEHALAKLDEGQWTQARELAERLRHSTELTYDEYGGPPFILGALAAEEAAAQWNAQARDQLYLVAGRYLEEARKRGFPAGREAYGAYMLAKSLFYTQQYAQALPVLLEALPLNPQHAVEIKFMLAESYLSDSDPHLKEALEWNAAYLAEAALEPADRQAALVQRGRIHLQLDDLDACREALGSIASDSPHYADAVILQSQICLAEGDERAAEAEAKYRQALELLREAQAHDRLSNRATRKAQLLMGLAYRRLHDYRAALAQFERVRKIYFDTPEARAALLEEADMHYALGEGEKALAAYLQVLRDAGKPQTYVNAWLPLSELRRRLLDAYRKFSDEKNFRHAAELARAFHPPFERSQSVELMAQANRQWGEALAEQAETAAADQAARLREESRQRYRRAGRLFARLADLRIVYREYPADVWSAADCLLRGHDYEAASAMFGEYLKNESRQHRAQALVGSGEAQLALGRTREALERLNECIEFFPQDPACYRARLIASQCYREEGELLHAKELLLDNIYHDSLTPQSVEWRDSLFALGNLLYSEGVGFETKSRGALGRQAQGERLKRGLGDLERASEAFNEAVRRLEEAVERYPQSPQAIQARYYIAQGYKQAARLPQQKLGSVTIETTRATLMRDLQRLLAASLASFQNLQESLNQRQEERELNSLEATMLRNCYFSQGAILFDLGQYEEAIRAYSAASNRYQHEPESLEAFLQIAECYRRLHRLPEARGTIEQAKVVLRRIRDDANFASTTRYSREEWQDLLDWMSTL